MGMSHCLIPEPENLAFLNSIILQQDGAAAHYAVDEHSFLNNQLTLGPLTWTPENPKLNMCDRWLCSFVKEAQLT
jgi:hypothetical protein